jgi:hypothetical protein
MSCGEIFRPRKCSSTTWVGPICQTATISLGETSGPPRHRIVSTYARHPCCLNRPTSPFFRFALSVILGDGPCLTTESGPSQADRPRTRRHAGCSFGTRQPADPRGSHRDPAATLAANGRIGGDTPSPGRCIPARAAGIASRPAPVPDAGLVAIAGSNPSFAPPPFRQDRRSVRLSDGVDNMTRGRTTRPAGPPT